MLNLGDEKVTKTLWQVCNGNVRWQRGSLCFAEQFVRHSKKLLSGRANVYLAPVVKLPGVPYASLHRGPLLDEDFPVNSQASKLQTLVYDILPSSIAVFSYAIGSRKLSANEQFFVRARTVVSLLQTTQIISDACFINDHVAYAN